MNSYASSNSPSIVNYRQFHTELISSDEFKERNIIKKKESRFNNLLLHLKDCGKLARRKWYCKQCEDEGKEALLRDEKIYQNCGVRYCTKPKCILMRFSNQINSLKGIKRLMGLRKLWHFVIGFEEVELENFVNNFDTIKKNQERVMNLFFSKLRKKNIKVVGFKILDFTFKNNKVYLHFHFITLPFKREEQKRIMMSMQQTRKQMLKHQKKKLSFHVQVMGNKSKSALLSYLSIRAVGLYKKSNTKESGYDINSKRKLKDLIESGKFMFLKDLVDVKTYFKHFYNHRCFTTIGGMPYGSIIMDNLSDKFPNKCKFHGKLERHQVRMELLTDDPPPPSQKSKPIEVIKIEGSICKACFKEYHKEDMHNSNTCKFCHNNQDPINKFNKQFENAL